MKALITGTGRCGTRWLANVLRDAGIAAGHEEIYRPGQIVDRPDIDVDVSWLALTHKRRTRRVPTLLMAREPTGCIASLIDSGAFTQGTRYTKALQRAMRQRFTGEPFVDACAWWVWVNTREFRLRWRIDQPDDLLGKLAALGLDAANVNPHTPPDAHPLGGKPHTKPRTTMLTWDDLPGEVLRVAAGWGWC